MNSLLLPTFFAPVPNPGPVNDGSPTIQQSSCPETIGQQTPSGSDHTPSSPSSPRNYGTRDLCVRERKEVTCDNGGQWFHADCQSVGSSYADLDRTEIIRNCLVMWQQLNKTAALQFLIYTALGHPPCLTPIQTSPTVLL